MSVILKVGDRNVKSTDITYADLVCLYRQFIDAYGFVPRTTECDSKHNMPQMRIINKVLESSHITYKDFLRMFGKYSKVRTESGDFSQYLERYHQVAKVLGHAPRQNDLLNNAYGLPGSLWFVHNCPDCSVHTYDQFVRWCGYDTNKLKRWEKDEVSEALTEYQKILGRPIRREDVKTSTVGFSMIVVNRLYGSLGNAKAEIGLENTPPSSQPMPFEYYRDILKDTVLSFINKTGRTRITWRDIESGIYGVVHSHKTYMKAFEDAGVNIFQYVKSIGCEMNDSTFGFKYTFDDGERVRSAMEYDFSIYLRSIGLKYGIDYKRDVKYRDYFCVNSRIDCDYVININNRQLFVEIAGIIFQPSDCDFSEYDYGNDKANTYRDKMILKRQVLEEAGADYLFLYSNDMRSHEYIDIFENHLKKMNLAA